MGFLGRVLLALLVAGCAAVSAPPSIERPRLVVVLVVDGMPGWQVEGYRDQLGADGLNRFLQRGAWFAEAHYGQALTLTGPGHATILTGAYPRRTGIVGNEWYDPESGELVYCAGDAGHAYIGHRTARLAGTSPRNLKAESLGDVLRRADARSKAIAISGKDRGAILPAGREGTAYMFMAQTGQFASSTYYMKEHPAWVTAFNAAKPADRFFKASWTPLLPEMAYARSLPDGEPWYAPGGRLPKVMGEGHDAPGPRFYASLFQSPFLDALTLDFARAAIRAEALGEDDAPDLLVVSLSSHDYVNHAWSAESRLSHDHVLQVDQLLGGFFRHLDRVVGPGRYLALLTADHGFMPAPEHSRARGRDAGRLDLREARARLEAGLAARFGEGPWVRQWHYEDIVLDRAHIAAKGLEPRVVHEEVRRLVQDEPGIAAVFTRAELASDAPADSPLLAAARKSWDPERSPDILVLPKPWWMFGPTSSATTHGSPHAYDSHVPILFYGPPWVKAGRVDARVEVADIAPTLASILGIAPPASAEGRPLPLPR